MEQDNEVEVNDITVHFKGDGRKEEEEKRGLTLRPRVGGFVIQKLRRVGQGRVLSKSKVPVAPLAVYVYILGGSFPLRWDLGSRRKATIDLSLFIPFSFTPAITDQQPIPSLYLALL